MGSSVAYATISNIGVLYQNKVEDNGWHQDCPLTFTCVLWSTYSCSHTHVWAYTQFPQGLKRERRIIVLLYYQKGSFKIFSNLFITCVCVCARTCGVGVCVHASVCICVWWPVCKVIDRFLGGFTQGCLIPSLFEEVSVGYLLSLFPCSHVLPRFTVQNWKAAFKLTEHDILTISAHHDSSQFTFSQLRCWGSAPPPVLQGRKNISRVQRAPCQPPCEPGSQTASP